MTQETTNKMLSFLDPAQPQPWASFIEQIDRVAPHLGELGYWLETLKHGGFKHQVQITQRDAA